MRFLSSLTGRDFRAVTAGLPPSIVTDPSTYPLVSPWSSSNMQRILFEDIYGSDLPANTRSAAMRIASVARARNLLCNTIARQPLVQLGLDERVPAVDDVEARAAFRDAQPTWLYRSDDGTSPQAKILWTVDDLIFYGWSCWWRENGSDGFPLTTTRINQGDWTVNADNRVEVFGTQARDNQVILIGGNHEGILTYGRDVIQDARQLYAIVRQRLASPVPPIDLHQEEGEPLTQTQIDELIDIWVAARNNSERGGVGFTSRGIKANVLAGTDDGQLMIDARNAAAVDVARMIGISAGMIDATAPKASLNYETTTGRNQEFTDLDVNQYMSPLEWRLSMDDVSPRGKRVGFDLEQFTTPSPSPTGPAFQD